jgi:hypothetical protein
VNGVSASVIFVTAHYDLHCNVPIRAGRALDAFNDHTTRFLELQNVKFFERARSEPLLEVGNTLLVKDNVHLALLLNEDRTNERKVFFATQEKRTVQAVMSLPTVIVKGDLHLKSASDAHGFLSVEAGSFFPVTNAVVFGYTAAVKDVQSPVVLVKKDAICSLTL